MIQNILRHDLFPPIASLSTATIGTLGTDVVLQRLAWTLAIFVSFFAIIRYIYRFYKWMREWRFQLKDYTNEDDD